MHILIIGNSDTDRAGFLDALLQALPALPKLYGYRSVKEPAGEDGWEPIYLYPAQGPRLQSEENLLGFCKTRTAKARPEAFEQNAWRIETAAPDGLLILDEIGPMEGRSPRFSKAVLAALDGQTPILATVRDNDTPFLNQVRNHPKAQLFFLTPETAQEEFPRVLAALKEQLQQLKINRS